MTLVIDGVDVPDVLIDSEASCTVAKTTNDISSVK